MALFEIVTMTDDSGMSRVLTDDLARRTGRELSAPDAAPPSVDLTGCLAGVVESPDELGELSEEDRGRWYALALAATAADIVGAARGAHALACEYAKVREQYGSTIGSYQAVAHLLAESLELIEGKELPGIAILEEGTK